MMARSSIPPAVATVRRRNSGSGFSIPNESGPQTATVSLGEAKVFEKLYREARACWCIRQTDSRAQKVHRVRR